MASSPTQQSSRLLDLPAEIRLNIYKLLIPEIGIKSLRPKLSISQPTTSQNKKHEKDKTSQSFNPGLQILFICRQIYAEVKPVVDTAPIVLFRAVWTETVDYSNQPPQCNLRVSKAIFDSWALLQFRHYLRRGMDRMAYGSGPGSLLHTFPNLRLVYFNQSKNPWNGYTAYHLELPKFIAKWLRDEQNSHEDKITGLLQHFEQIEGVTGREFKAIDSVIKENHLTLSMSYTWKMRGYKVNGRYLKLFMTEPNESTLVWDENGVHIEGLPDLRRKWWWHALSNNLSDTSNDENERSVFELCDDVRSTLMRLGTESDLRCYVRCGLVA